MGTYSSPFVQRRLTMQMPFTSPCSFTEYCLRASSFCLEYRLSTSVSSQMRYPVARSTMEQVYCHCWAGVRCADASHRSTASCAMLETPDTLASSTPEYR